MIRMVSALLMTALLCSGCVSLDTRSDELTKADQLLQGKRYSEAIVAYETIAKVSAGTAQAADAALSAAKIHAFYDNPHKDYAAALQLFDEFVKKYPDHELIREAYNWRYFLKTLLELKKENERLNLSIEQLKKIDIKHEERRRK